MSSKSKTFDGVLVTGVDCFSGKDARRNAGSGWELGCGCGVAYGGIAVEAVAGSKVCRPGAESGFPFTVRARDVGDPTEVTKAGSFRTDGSRRGWPGFWDGENGRPSLWVD
jgi:hypothetical protein